MAAGESLISMSLRTELGLELKTYGHSVLKAQLSWFPPSADCKLLIIAGIHGEEPDTTVSLSRAIRSIETADISESIGLILTANPDGLQLGTRGNARGVDLNRNFPTTNWQAEPTNCRWHADEDLALPILTGNHAGSEPETAALIELIRSTSPDRILALHGPLACIDDPQPGPFAEWLAEETGLPLHTEIGYPTPGSLGTWGDEQGIPVTTLEFPPEGIEILSRTQVPTLVEILRGNCPM